jgi:Cu-Zn family superoxide dismutase
VSGLVAAVLFATTALAQTVPVGAIAEVRDAAGRLVATAEFREGRGEVLVSLKFPSPAPLTGAHAVHIEEVGRCDPPDFRSAGADFNPFNKKHGRLNPEGPRVGDLPNVNFAGGLTSYNTSAAGASLAPGPASLLGPNGTAVVIYSGEDDQLSEPDGNAGTRIACGVILRAAAPGGIAKPAVVPSVAVTAVAVASPVAVPPVPARPASSPPPVPSVVPQPASSPVPAAPVSVAASPVVIVAAPTPPPLAAAPAPQSDGRSLGSGQALLIAVLGVGLFGAGYLLRRRSQLR